MAIMRKMLAVAAHLLMHKEEYSRLVWERCSLVGRSTRLHRSHTKRFTDPAKYL